MAVKVSYLRNLYEKTHIPGYARLKLMKLDHKYRNVSNQRMALRGQESGDRYPTFLSEYDKDESHRLDNVLSNICRKMSFWE